jgi:DNA polymerase zeta
MMQKLTIHSVNAYILRLGRSLNYAMCVSLERDPSKKYNQFVAFIALCKGVPFYGFHVGYRYYLKIYATEPTYMSRLVELLRSGSVMHGDKNKKNGDKGFSVYEAHVPYLLQFMLDFNLYGCGWIELEDCKFRSPLPGV